MIRVMIFATLLLALPATAQERIWRVGLLSNGTQTSTTGQPTWRDGILQVLSENGFNLNKNLELVERHSDGNFDRLPRLAGEMSAVRPDVVVAVSDVSVRAALAAIAATPVVMVVGEDPIASGFVSGYARPGGRVTGVFFDTDEGDEKRLQLLVETIPGARRFGLLVPFGLGPRRAERLARTATALRIDLMTHVVGGPDEYSPAFAAMKTEGAAGVLVASSQAWGNNIVSVVAAAMENRLPTICEWEFQARLGCTLGYGHDISYSQRRVGEYVVRILRGAKPSELPVEAPDQWKLTVNLKAARALGIAIPGLIMARANEVIE